MRVDFFTGLPAFPPPRAEAFSPASWTWRWQLMLSQMDRVDSAEERSALISRYASGEGQRTMAFVNAHAFNLCVADGALASNVLAADLVLRDGIGTKLACRLLGFPPGINLNGTDLIPELLPHFAGRKVALFGTSSDTARRAAQRVAQLVGDDIIVDHGFHSDAHYVARAQADRPALILLAMGMPKQERVAAQLREALDHNVAIVCGGAILDFLAGDARRAPRWMRRAGLEWVFRLINEPKRLFARYVRGNPLFLMRVLLAASGFRATPRRSL
jgi:exopolysaccharide biosynthesis WecB/TagA/CpsF family protein